VTSPPTLSTVPGRWSAGELKRVRRAVTRPPTLPSVLGHVGLQSGRSPDRGSASRDVGRRRVASTAVQHRRARRSLIRRPFQEKSPGQWPDLLVVTVTRKIACFLWCILRVEFVI